ncbi:hypothetical protein HU200_055937 [Digitaria exilis]|uniref:Proliferating cell nuclear antigen n=1 Tax=Digitaria exilis TaxID=1010633 RepID=A0A835AN29_9POAL|nr:hypothetical protein HU200_055937 [Digitaria exilis]
MPGLPSQTPPPRTMPATLLKLQLLETTLFKNVLEALGDLFSKANFNFSSTGIEIQAVHSTNTFVCSLPAGAFHQDHSNRDLSIEMNLDDLALVFGTVNDDDVRDIDVKDDGFNCLVFSFKSKIPGFQPKESILIDAKEYVTLSFDLEHLNSLSKLSTLSDQVTISLSSKLPTVFEYEVADSGYIRCMMQCMEMGDADLQSDEMQN